MTTTENTAELSIGQTIRQAREKKKLTINDVREKTCIRTLFIEAIENDDFDRLPSGIYTRMYIKSYAKTLGINAQTLIDKLSDISTTEIVEPIVEEKINVQKFEPPQIVIWGSLAACLILLLIFFSKDPQKKETINLGNEIISAISSSNPEISIIALQPLTLDILNEIGDTIKTHSMAEGEVYFIPLDTTPLVSLTQIENLEFYLNGNKVLSVDNLEKKFGGIILDGVKMQANITIDSLSLANKNGEEDISTAIDNALSTSTNKNFSLNKITPSAGDKNPLNAVIDSIELGENN